SRRGCPHSRSSRGFPPTPGRLHGLRLSPQPRNSAPMTTARSYATTLCTDTRRSHCSCASQILAQHTCRWGASPSTSLPTGMERNACTMDDVRFSVRKWVKPEDLNQHGALFGGRLLQWVDEEAAIFAITQIGTTSLVTR